MISNNSKDIFSDYISNSDLYMTTSDNSSSKIFTKLTENDYYMIKSMFNKVENDLKETKLDIRFSGSTANLIILLDKKLICVNCGDSRAILNIRKHDKAKCKVSTKTGSDQEDWYVLALSQDHKPELEEERRRIINCNGRVEKYNTDEGPFRVWLKDEDTPGLAMSRSLGDSVAKTVGVIYQPGAFSFNNKIYLNVILMIILNLQFLLQTAFGSSYLMRKSAEL